MSLKHQNRLSGSMFLFVLLFGVELTHYACAQTANQVSIGDEICVEGYIMDLFCIELGVLMDNQSVKTLVGPEKHSIHCLVDIPQCRAGPYEVLIDPKNSGDEYARGWRIDEDGTKDLVELARKTGKCDTCGDDGTLTNGFRATVTGTVTDLGDSSTPAQLKTISVQASTIGCNGVVYDPPNLVSSSGNLLGKSRTHGALMLVSWGLLLPSGAIIARFAKQIGPKDLWFKTHQVCQITGLIIAIVGWILALVYFNALNPSNLGQMSHTHAVLGMVTMALGISQPFNAFLRPHPPSSESEEKSTGRKVWEILHKGSGWAAIILAVVTISIGTTLIPDATDQRTFQIVYGVGVGGALLSLMVIIQLRNLKKKRKDHEYSSPS